jgi:GTP cyclohydrolase II
MIPADFLRAGSGDCATGQRPLITLSYAQSLDGAIAPRRGSKVALSCPESMVLTHRLRASHDAILVGIGTVLADDPCLTVRLVDGKDPCPIVLDSHLRLPLGSNLLKNKGQSPLIATTELSSRKKQAALEEQGARVLRIAHDSRGWVDLPSLVKELSERGMSRVMVEGGARVITSFLSQRLIDRLVLTIAPRLTGGLHALEVPLMLHGNGGNGNHLPRFSNSGFDRAGTDMVFWSELSWVAQ